MGGIRGETKLKGRCDLSTTVRKHKRTTKGAGSRPGRKFSFVFFVDLEPIRRPGKEGAINGRVFVLRTRAKSRAAAVSRIANEFGQPEILAAFDGWPELFRGESITSMADVVNRYGPEALAAEHNAQAADAAARNAAFNKAHPCNWPVTVVTGGKKGVP